VSRWMVRDGFDKAVLNGRLSMLEVPSCVSLSRSGSGFKQAVRESQPFQAAPQHMEQYALSLLKRLKVVRKSFKFAQTSASPNASPKTDCTTSVVLDRP